MKPRTEYRLNSAGCLLLLIGTCAFGYLALTYHWIYFAAVAGLIGLWLVFSSKQSRREHGELVGMLESAFAPSGQPLPQLKIGNSYGFPSFKLTFSSEVALRQAEESGAIAVFKRAVQSRYDYMGHKSNPFNADQAVMADHA